MRTLFLSAAVLVVSVGLAAPASAEYWAVGSFNSLSAAKSESQRLEQATGEHIRIAKFDFPGGTMYRLMVLQSANLDSQKQALVSAGAQPWLSPKPNRRMEFLDAEGASKANAPEKKARAGRSIANTASGGRHLLVVASFIDMQHAEAFAGEISSRGMPMVTTATGESHGTRVYRVVSGPWSTRDASIRGKAEEAGVPDSWWIASSKLVVTNPAPEPEPEPVAMIEPPAPEPPKHAPVPLRPPRPDESYFDYCVKKASPREREKYCADGQFSIAVREEQVRHGLGGQEYFDFCTRQASMAQREKYCKDMTFSDRVSP